ncbi:Ctr-domain-containing protein [Gonapodya prolifera JEL478]|uniref:Copper transport protein n=1 Tax=Gonapodya prolifera (strain JEL478) TaxID=1344416 RepID=A0A139AHW9_GONPJ|nr:Ctr-domain-containing protein [Gonapodya prolifera JEL478]|eukprot:KXS16360.1 Ctr-domain-containing protein [Gonapodya prolifera JEL478]
MDLHMPVPPHAPSDDGGMTHSMSMVWNWDTNLTIVFPSWKTHSSAQLAVACVVVFALAAGYEWIQSYRRSYDRALLAAAPLRRRKVDRPTSPSGDLVRPLLGDKEGYGVRASDSQQLSRSTLHFISVFLGYFLMLTSMSFNGYIIFSITAGAGAGYFMFSKEIVASVGAGNESSAGCH